MARSATTSDAFNAVAEGRRREILELLASAPDRSGAGGGAAGEWSVNDVVASLGLAQPQVSKHLRVLREVNLVRVRGSGRCRFYSLNADRLRPIHDWVQTFERFWDQQLLRIKERAEASVAQAARRKPRTSNQRKRHA